MVCLSAVAQTPLPVGTWNYGFSPVPTIITFPSMKSGSPDYRWQLKPYTSLSAGYLFYHGGGASYLSAQSGLALFRPLNQNWTVYGAATVSPVVVSGNGWWTAPIADPNYHGYPFGGYRGLGLSTGLQGGLIYTNPDRTFSISGSVHVERGYPVYPVYPGVPPRQARKQ